MHFMQVLVVSSLRVFFRSKLLLERVLVHYSRHDLLVIGVI